MKGFVVLLRGFNTGNLRMTKDALSNLVRRLGYDKFELISNTGNIVLFTDGNPSKILDEIIHELTVNFGQNMFGHIRSFDEMLLLEPHLKALVYDVQQYILFGDKETSKELYEVFELIDDDKEKLDMIGHDLYWTTPRGYTLKSFGRIALGDKKYKKLVTSRNITTIKKIIECIQHG
ncbi:DUF1697 domain-containing protein [Mycoplasmatota bacterium]|nr:DUF1697 domain-containing protein [Mycoplasmatota bacterium]